VLCFVVFCCVLLCFVVYLLCFVVCVRVYVCVKRPVSVWVPVWVTPSRGGSDQYSQTPSAVEKEEAPLLKRKVLERTNTWPCVPTEPEIKIDCAGEANSNLPDRPFGSCKTYEAARIYDVEILIFFSSSLLPHLGACSRFWSIGLSFLSFLIRDSR
jgi:hypothetical protein